MLSRLIALPVGALAIAAAIHGPAPRFDAWKIIGPGGAGAMFLPTVSPHDPNLVLEHCDMTGAYISRDAGHSWRMFNLRGTVSAFAFDPGEPKVIYAANQALYRSDDTGRTWKMIFPNPARNTLEHMLDDHAAGFLTSDDPAYPRGVLIRQIAIDPSDPNRIYAAFGGNRTAICFSPDHGVNWKRVREARNEALVLLYFDRGLHLVTGSGVLTQEGAEWKAGMGPSTAPIESAAAGAGMLYATSADGIFSSQDCGKSWQAIGAGLADSPRFHTVACSARHPETAYVALTYPSNQRRSAIAKTSDRGAHWALVYRSSGKSAPNVENAWIEDFYGGTGPIRDLGVAPSNPDICYATDSCPRSFRTLDGGKTWQQTISEHVAGDRWTTTGFDVTTCYGVHFDPFRSATMFISYTDVGLFKSDDSGATWKSSIIGIPRQWQNTTYWVEFDPKVKGLMWGAFARTHDLPRAKMWQRFDPDEFMGGVGTSTDGGEHWSVTNTGMPETAVTHIVLDPTSPTGSRTLYACGFGRGVYKSSDGGRMWTLSNDGIEKKQPFAWRITRGRDGTLYLIVARRSQRGYTGDAEDGALYKSTDGASHWVKLKLPEGTNGPTGLAIDPVDQRRMYLSAWGAQLEDRDAGGGVFVSGDGGETWKNIFDQSQHVYDVTIDARNPNVLYNCGFEVGAWRSTDRGKSWTRIRGFNFKWGHRVIPDPMDSARIYITTFGGSVWHGPAAGDAQSAEDIVTPIQVAR
jgi:photosystem II stability/assembly factor-like uncharacterized protein